VTNDDREVQEMGMRMIVGEIRVAYGQRDGGEVRKFARWEGDGGAGANNGEGVSNVFSRCNTRAKLLVCNLNEISFCTKERKTDLLPFFSLLILTEICCTKYTKTLFSQ
jgi:hypothetical protein